MTFAVLSSPPARRSGRAMALATSVLLHLLALLCLRLDAPSPRAPVPPQPLRVRILPITPDAGLAEPVLPHQAPARQAGRQASAVRSATSVRPARNALAPPRAGKADASAAGQAPRLTLEGLRRQMRNLEPENPNAKPLPENPQQARLARGIDRAERADCKHAYAGLGLLAAPMLLKDALDKDNGCKW